MRLSAALAAACVLTCGAAAALAPEAAAPVSFGMAAPLAAGLATIRLVERTVQSDVSRLTGRLAVAFAVKLVFYAAYVAVVIGWLRVAPAPFALSFALYFAALQVAEGLYFRTLLTNAAAQPSGGR